MERSLMSVPMRKRTVRACDQCRRRKTKCDGKLSCSACSNIGLGCSYGHQIKQTRGPTYVVHLEKKVEELEKQVRRTSADDIIDGVAESSQGSQSSDDPESPLLRKSCRDSAVSMPQLNLNTFTPGPKTRSLDFSKLERVDQAFNTSVNEHERSCRTKAPRQTYCPGPEAIKSVRQLCNQAIGIETGERDASIERVAEAFDHQFPFQSLSSNAVGYALLPSKERLRHWIDLAFDNAFRLWPFVDRPSLDWNVHRLYNTDTFGRDADDRDHLALIYIVLALGQRFDTSPIETNGSNHSNVELQGLPFFAAAHEIVGMWDSGRSLVTIQITMCMSIYLMAARSFSSAHTYICSAATAAMRMGLHKSADDGHLPDGQRILRQQTFSYLEVLDIYISSCLGLPRITRAHKNWSMPINNATGQKQSQAVLQTLEAHHRLVAILGKAMETRYTSNHSMKDVSRSGLLYQQMWSSMEALDSWMATLPDATSSNGNGNSQPDIQLMLMYVHAYVQMVVYHPSLQYLTKAPASNNANAHFYGSKCINAAFQAVDLAEQLSSRCLLHEANPLTVLVLALATTILAFAELSAMTDSGIKDPSAVGGRAKTLLEGLASRSQSARVFLESLKPIHDRSPQTARMFEPFTPSFGAGSFYSVHSELSPTAQPTMSWPDLTNTAMVASDYYWLDKAVGQPLENAGSWQA